tara:strand:+ start:606 stop:857 length:252 start_codon:yes stop_codon:yes gene_type:complete
MLKKRWLLKVSYGMAEYPNLCVDFSVVLISAEFRYNWQNSTGRGESNARLVYFMEEAWLKRNQKEKCPPEIRRTFVPLSREPE